MSYEPISYVQIVGGGAVNWYELPVREGRCFEPRDCPAVDWNEWSPEMADAGMTERLVQVKDGRWAKCSVGPDEGLWGGRLVEPEEAAVWLGKNGHEEAARALTDAPGRPVERERGGVEEQRRAWLRRAVVAEPDGGRGAGPLGERGPERGGPEQ